MFREIFYWIYVYMSNSKTNKTPAISSYALLSLLLGFNIITIYILFTYFFKISISFNDKTTFFLALGIGIIAYTSSYFCFYSKRNEIILKYDKLQKGRKIKGQIFSFMYVIISFVGLFVCGINLVRH
jgi:hypothetical protein